MVNGFKIYKPGDRWGKLLGVPILKKELYTLLRRLNNELMLQTLSGSREMKLRSSTQPSYLPKKRLKSLGKKQSIIPCLKMYTGYSWSHLRDKA